MDAEVSFLRSCCRVQHKGGGGKLGEGEKGEQKRHMPLSWVKEEGRKKRKEKKRKERKGKHQDKIITTKSKTRPASPPAHAMFHRSLQHISPLPY